MDTLEFKNLLELKIRIKPALESKVEELRRNNIKYINEDEIFEYLRETKWNYSNNLDLANIVDDILNTKNEDIANFCVDKKLAKNNKN